MIYIPQQLQKLLAAISADNLVLTAETKLVDLGFDTRGYELFAYRRYDGGSSHSNSAITFTVNSASTGR